MPLLENLRQLIKSAPPISEEEAEALAKRAHEAVGGRLVAREGEKQETLDALQGMREFAEYRTAVMARQLRNAAEAWAHERNVVIPAEGVFAAQYGFTADDLEEAWGKRRNGTQGRLFRQEIEQKAALRDEFYALVDVIGAEMMGEEYDYGRFIAGIAPEALLQSVQARLDAQSQG